jgi:dihydrofolate reductase
MRKLVVTENITIDGVIDATGGWFEPAADAGDNSDLVEALAEQAASADAFLVGRVTCLEMRGYWPKQTDDQTGVSDYLNRVAKYVVSRTLTDPEWENSTVLSGPLTEEIQVLKSQPGADIVTTGSIQLVHDLIAAGLADEYRLFVYPRVLGRGARLFADATTVPPLTLTDSRPFRSGVVLLTYAVTA